MPLPAKPCEGRFSDEVQQLLVKNTDRAQWANHSCEICGFSVGAKQDRGKWVPEQHWPSVKIRPRTPNERKKNTPADAAVPEESVALAESSSR